MEVVMPLRNPIFKHISRIVDSMGLEAYAAGYAKDREAAIAPYVAAAEEARRVGLGLNAGHDLNTENLQYFIERIPWVDEVSIGHALISDALYWGLENTVEIYQRCIRRAKDKE